MRLFVLCVLLLTLAACSTEGGTGDPLPPNIQLGADVILSQSTATAAQAQAQAAQANAQAAQARSQAIAAQGTAVRQVTLDAMNARSTDAAIRLAFAQVTQTAEARRATDVAQENARSATEIAQAHVEATRGLETSIARGETRAAVQTATRHAEEFATGTRQAERPTQTRVAEIARQEQMTRLQAQEIEQARYAQEKALAPVLRAFELFFPYLFGLGIFVLCSAVVWGIGEAFQRLINSRALKTSADALAQTLIIKDPAGNPLGYLELARDLRSYTFTPFERKPRVDALPVTPEKQTVTPQQIAPPPEPLIGGVFYRSTLLAFLEKIRETGDWTQDTWANQPLPRGYVMSMDTVDEHGETVYGGYSKMLTYFVTHNLIVGRSRGSSGKWNPNAPTETGDIMAILENNAPLPALPPVPVRASKPHPSPARSRVRETAPSV